MRRPVIELVPLEIVKRVLVSEDVGSPALLFALSDDVGTRKSIVMDNVPVAVPLFPAESTIVAETVHVPSDDVGNEQLVTAPVVYVHVTVDAPFVADTVTTSPVRDPGIEISGVVSLVMLSVFDAPESDDGSRSGAGRDGGEVAIVMGRELDALEVLSSESVSVAVMSHVPSVSVGSVHSVAVPMT